MPVCSHTDIHISEKKIKKPLDMGAGYEMGSFGRAAGAWSISPISPIRSNFQDCLGYFNPFSMWKLEYPKQLTKEPSLTYNYKHRVKSCNSRIFLLYIWGVTRGDNKIQKILLFLDNVLLCSPGRPKSNNCLSSAFQSLHYRCIAPG